LKYTAFLEERSRDEQFLVPSIDVAWIWYLHLLHPANYRQYCSSKFGKILFPQPNELTSSKLSFDSSLCLDGANCDITMPTFSDGKSCSWSDLHEKQVTFYNKIKRVNLSQGSCKRMTIRFLRFLSLVKKNTGIIVPTLEIDLVWHSVLHCPDFYLQLCRHHAGKFIDHNDLMDDEFLSVHFEETKKAYSTIYNEEYSTKLTSNNNTNKATCGGCSGVCAGGGCMTGAKNNKATCGGCSGVCVGGGCMTGAKNEVSDNKASCGGCSGVCAGGGCMTGAYSSLQKSQGPASCGGCSGVCAGGGCMTGAKNEVSDNKASCGGCSGVCAGGGCVIQEKLEEEMATCGGCSGVCVGGGCVGLA